MYYEGIYREVALSRGARTPKAAPERVGATCSRGCFASAVAYLAFSLFVLSSVYTLGAHPQSVQRSCKLLHAREHAHVCPMHEVAVDRPALPSYLLHAVQRGDVKKCRSWLQRGGRVDAQCTELTGYSLLHVAAVKERCQLVAELINRGAPVDLRSDEGSTALMAAAEQNTRGSAVVRLLLEHAANPNLAQQDGITALMSAARTRHDAIVTTLLENSARPDQRARNGATALMIAAVEGHCCCVRALLAAQADPGLAKDGSGRTALSFAEERGHVSTIQLLRGKPGPTKTPRARRQSPDSLLVHDIVLDSERTMPRSSPSAVADASVVQSTQASEWARADAAMAELLADEAAQAQLAKPKKGKGKKKPARAGPRDRTDSAALAAMAAGPAATELAAAELPAAEAPAAEPTTDRSNTGRASIQRGPAAGVVANADALCHHVDDARSSFDAPEPADARPSKEGARVKGGCACHPPAAPVKVPHAFVCPLTFEIMQDPVLLVGDGQTYERAEIERWLQTKQTSPMTNAKLTTTLIAPNVALRGLIIEFREAHSGVDLDCLDV